MNKFLVISFIFTSFVFGLFLNVNSFVLADEFKIDEIETLKTSAKSKLNPANLSDPNEVAGRFLLFWIAPIGALALIFTIVAGVMWMTASGNAEKISQATKIITWVFLGVLATLMSYMLLRILFEFAGGGL